MKGFFKRNRKVVDHEAPIAVLNQATASCRIPDQGIPTDGQPVRTGSQSITASCPAWHSPEDHAVALLHWLQGPGGRVGEVPASEIMQAHAEMCAEYFWEPAPWIPVAKALRHLLKDPKHRYASRKSRRVVVYLIPQAPAKEPLE
jgi:hypothetical protein